MEILIFIIIIYAIGWSVSGSTKSPKKTSEEKDNETYMLYQIFFVVAAIVLFIIYIVIPLFSSAEPGPGPEENCHGMSQTYSC